MGLNNNNLNHYNILADLIDFPYPGYHQKVGNACNLLKQVYPSAQTVLTQFKSYIDKTSPEKTEELYLRTFAIQAVTTLDIGYVLFGDDYKRGELLVNLSREHAKAGNDCGNELADNLANLLRLLSITKDSEFRNELVGIIVLPALGKIISEFDIENINIKNKVYNRKYKTLIEQPEDSARMFLLPLLAIQKILEKDFGLFNTKKIKTESNFTDSIVNEIKID